MISAPIPSQVERADLKGLDDLLHLRQREIGHLALMIRRFDDDLMRPHTVALIEDPEAPPIQVALDLERRKFVGDHAQLPALSVRR